MNEQIKEDGLTCAYLLGKADGYKQGRADKYQEITSEYILLTEKQVEEIRADAIEDFKIDMLNKICFEEKWLFDCKSNNADTNIAFSALRTFAENRAEQLKEQKND